METRIKDVMAAILGLDAAGIGPHTTAQAVESWDSLNQMNLAIALEGAFSIEIPVEDILLLTSYAAVVEVVRRQVAG